MRLAANGGILCALLVILWARGSSLAFGQGQTRSTPLETLEREFTDPLTTLPQVFLKDAFSPVNYGTEVQTNQVVGRAIIPRIPPNTLLPFVQLVRPTFSLVTVPTPGGGTRTDFGDIQLFDLAVLPWPRAETGLRFGLGPTFVFPTATSKFAGQGAWQAGPACAAVYTGVPRLLIGFLLQILSPSHTHHLIGLRRILLRSNRQCSFLSGTAGTCALRMQHGCMGGAVIPLLCCR